jgi:hypothetical protein
MICSAVASPDIMLQYCAQCQSALYCSKACQRIDWKKKQHKKICKLLNVGHGDCQIRTERHTNRQIALKERFEIGERSLDADDKHFFKLFTESTFKGSQAAALEMRKIAERQTKHGQTLLLFHSLHVLVRSSNSEMLSWPNSPLLVMLHFFDLSVLFRQGEWKGSLLHQLADLADPFEHSTHGNQLILANQLIEHGADVNAVLIPDGSRTPLHKTCYWGNVTNLDFVELLLKAGADPNAKECLGLTPLMYTIPASPGAAKYLLNWPTTDANTTNRSGLSFLAGVRLVITDISEQIALPDNPDKVQLAFSLQQWRDIEATLVERGVQ